MIKLLFAPQPPHTTPDQAPRMPTRITYSIITLATTALLTACASAPLYAPVIAPDQPAAELSAQVPHESDFGLGVRVVNEKGCYQSDALLDGKPGAPSTRVPAERTLVLALGGTVRYGYACRDTIRFKPEAGHKYVVQGRFGPDDADAYASKRSFATRIVNSNTEVNCHIAVFDETDPEQPQRVKTYRTGPRQAGFACIRFQ